MTVVDLAFSRRSYASTGPQNYGGIRGIFVGEGLTDDVERWLIVGASTEVVPTYAHTCRPGANLHGHLVKRVERFVDLLRIAFYCI